MKIDRGHIKKIVLGIYIGIIGLTNANAQFDAGLSQYMLNPSGFNPATVGMEKMVNISGQHRLNMIGMPNGGSTTLFDLSMPLKAGNIFQGAGILFINDKVGQFTNQGASLQLSFKKAIGRGVLSMGFGFGFTSIGFNGDSVAAHIPPIGEYHDLTADPEIPAAAVSGMGADLNAGVWYRTPKYYAGLSMSHINQPVIAWGDKFQFMPSSTVYLTMGYYYALSDPKWEIRPSMLFKTDFGSWQTDLSALAYYNKQYWGGLTLRTGESFVLLGGINLGTGLSIGYSYDLPTTTLITASSGSHEIFLTYSFELGGKNPNAKYKSIRIL